MHVYSEINSIYFIGTYSQVNVYAVEALRQHYKPQFPIIEDLFYVEGNG